VASEAPGLLGTSRWTLAGRTDKPVIVCSRRRTARASTQILMRKAGTPGKARASRTIELSSKRQLEIVVVHVDEEIPSFTDQVNTRRGIRQEFLARHVLGRAQAQLERRMGVPASEVLGAVESLKADS